MKYLAALLLCACSGAAVDEQDLTSAAHDMAPMTDVAELAADLVTTTDLADAPDMLSVSDMKPANDIAPSPDLAKSPELTPLPDMVPALSSLLGPCEQHSDCEGPPPPTLTDSDWLTRHPPRCIKPTYVTNGQAICAQVNYFQKAQGPGWQPKTCARLYLPAPWYMGAAATSSTEFCPPSNSQPIDIDTLTGMTVLFATSYPFEVQ